MKKLSPLSFQTLSAPIYNDLMEQLISGAYEPGQRLKLNELAEQTGTSVSPVREALIRLVAEDSVAMSSLRAFAIPSLSSSRFNQILSIRLVLEGLAVEKATENITQSEVEELSKLHAKFISAEANRERLEAQSLNRRIHFMIYDKANMPMLLSSILNLWAKMGPILRVYYSERIDVTIGAPDHLNLFEALDANDCLRAVAAVQADIIHGCSAIGNYIRELEGS